MKEKFTFGFNGGEYSPGYGPVALTQKSFLFGIVGGKEVPLYSMIKSGVAAKEPITSPVRGFNIRLDDHTQTWEQQPLPMFSVSIQYWKLFSGTMLLGVRKRSHSIYIKLTNNPMVPVSAIIPTSETGIYFREMKSIYSQARPIRTGHRFVGRFEFVNCDDLSGVLGSEGLLWSRRVPPPSIPMLKEMVSTSDNSRQVINRVIRQRKRREG